MEEDRRPICAASPKQQMVVDCVRENKAQILVIGGAAGCVSAETEFLTPEGWVRFSEYREGMSIGQYDPKTDILSFSEPLDYIKAPCQHLTLMKGKGMEMALSDEHKVLYWPDYKLNPKTLPFHEVKRRHNNSKTKGWTGKIKTTFQASGCGVDLTEGELRLQVAVMADGRVVKEGKDNYTQMRFSKKRKYDRLLELCEKYNLKYDDRGYKPHERYKSGKQYEVIVWPKLPDKRFDSKYYQCSQEQLEIICDEVGHWDGSIVPYKGGNSIRYYSKHKEDSDFIQYVFAANGMNTSMVFDLKEGCYEGSTGYWTVNGNSLGRGFRSFANKDRKNELEVVETSDGYKYCFTTQTGFFVARLNNKMFLTGNSGKSHLLQMLPLEFADCPKARCIMFRRNTDQLKGQGGLFELAGDIYQNLPKKLQPRMVESRLRAYFPSGAQVQWKHMEHEKDKFSHQGLQYTFVGFDEGTQFEWSQIEYLSSRMRSKSKYPSRMVISCNPDPDHKICDLIKDYFLDEDGQPIEERAGHIRYYVRQDGEFYFASSKEELGEKFNIPESKWHSRILSFSFIPMTIKDNPVVLEENPEYEAFLLGLDPVEKARLYFGNWFARPEGNSFFKRQWLRGENGERVKRVEDIPSGCTAMRAVDCAHSEPHEGNRDPDFTALSPLMLKDRDGFYWLLGNYSDALIDQPNRPTEKPVIGRIRRLAGERNNLLAKQGRMDLDLAKTYKYQKPKFIAAKDNGAGSSDFTSLLARLVEDGISVQQDRSPSNVPGKKVKDFLGFTEAAENGLVFIVEETFDKKTLEEYYKELEKFTGENSTRKLHDDWVDSTSMCFNNLRDAKRQYRTLNTNQQSNPTLSAGLLNRK